MELLQLRIIETIVILVVAIFIKLSTNFFIDRTIKRQLLNKTRGKLVKKIINFTLLLIAVNFILIVWGVNQSELILFMTSVLTVIGIALFAQWSILSNITAGLILFFNHSVRLEDTVTIMEKDYEIEGRISDIGFFFITLKTKEGDHISLPCNIFLQKTIKKKSRQETQEKKA